MNAILGSPSFLCLSQMHSDDFPCRVLATIFAVLVRKDVIAVGTPEYCFGQCVGTHSRWVVRSIRQTPHLVIGSTKNPASGDCFCSFSSQEFRQRTHSRATSLRASVAVRFQRITMWTSLSRGAHLSPPTVFVVNSKRPHQVSLLRSQTIISSYIEARQTTRGRGKPTTKPHARIDHPFSKAKDVAPHTVECHDSSTRSLRVLCERRRAHSRAPKRQVGRDTAVSEQGELDQERPAAELLLLPAQVSAVCAQAPLPVLRRSRVSQLQSPSESTSRLHRPANHHCASVL